MDIIHVLSWRHQNDNEDVDDGMVEIVATEADSGKIFRVWVRRI